MSLSADISPGRLFQFERSGTGPIDAEHAVITSVNDPKVGLQWRLRSLHFSRSGAGTLALDVFARLRSEPHNLEYLAKKLTLGTTVLDAAWYPGEAEALFVSEELEVAVEFAAAAGEEWRVLIIGEIVGK